MPRPDILAGLVGAGFSLSGFLQRFRLCALAGLGFGHAFFAFYIALRLSGGPIVFDRVFHPPLLELVFVDRTD